jgi:CRISPR-associated protein Cst1
LKIRLDMGDWMLTMGLLGLYRVYNYGVENNIVSKAEQKFVKIHQLGLEIDLRALEHLPEAFFRYMLDEYSIYDREQKRLQDQLGYAKTEQYFGDRLKEIKKIVNENIKKISKYFPGEIATELENIQARLKEVRKPEQLGELENCINDFLKISKLESVDEKLTINYFKTVVLKSFFGQPSFLNVSKTNLNLKEQMELFYEDYIRPVLLEINFQEHLRNAHNKHTVLAYLEEDRNYKPFQALTRQLKRLELEEIKDYVLNQVPECSLLPGYLAFSNFEEMIFSPLGVSTEKALNFQWDLERKQPAPISSLARLILFLAPAGGAIYGRWDGQGGQGAYRMYTGFIQTEGSFSDTLRRNSSFKSHKDKKDPFDKILSVLIEDLQKKTGYILEHLFFIEFFSDYDNKKTLLEYYHLPEHMARYIQTYGTELDRIRPYNYREQFVKAVLHGQDPIHVIWQQLKGQITNQWSGYGTYIATRERHRIMFYKKYLGEGVAELKKQDRMIWSVYKSGQEVRKTFELAEQGREEGAPHASSAGKKINGLAYRLLNTIKANNKKEFMDSLFRLYMPINKPVNPVFLNVLHEEQLDFCSVGTAFVAGLLSGGQQSDDQDKGENRNE